MVPRIQGDHELSLIESLYAASRTNWTNPFAFNSLRTNRESNGHATLTARRSDGNRERLPMD